VLGQVVLDEDLLGAGSIDESMLGDNASDESMLDESAISLKFHLDSAQNFIFIQSEISSLSGRNCIFIQLDKHLSYPIFSPLNA
jgi:hypothetical protein